MAIKHLFYFLFLLIGSMGVVAAGVSSAKPRRTAAEILENSANIAALLADKSKYDPSILDKVFGAAPVIDIQRFLVANPAQSQAASQSVQEAPAKYNGNPVNGFIEINIYNNDLLTDLHNRTTIPLGACVAAKQMGSATYNVDATGAGLEQTYYDPHCQAPNSRLFFQLPPPGTAMQTIDDYFQTVNVVSERTPHYMGLTRKTWVTNDCSGDVAHMDFLQIEDNCFPAPGGGFYIPLCHWGGVLYSPNSCQVGGAGATFTFVSFDSEIGGLGTCQSKWKKNSRSAEYSCGGVVHAYAFFLALHR